MSLNKVHKPQWADGAPGYVAEPSPAKKTLGWVSQEKPPFQWMNWLFLKIKEWLDWGEEKTEFSDSISFHTTGGSVDWDGADIDVPVDGLILEWRARDLVITNILPEATYSLADGEYLVFVPSDIPATALSLGVYGSLLPGQYAIVDGASLIDNTEYTEVVLFRRRGAVPGTAVLEVPIFKTAVQSGGSLAANDLLVHKHSDADDGGTLLWSNIFSPASAGDHDHSSNTKGGTSVGPLTSLTAANNLDIGAFQLRALTFYSDVATGTAPFTVASTTKVANLNADYLDDFSTYDGDTPVADRILVTQANGWLYTPHSAPTQDYHMANKKYVDDNTPDMTHVCMDNTAETITSAWHHENDLYMDDGQPLWFSDTGGDYNYINSHYTGGFSDFYFFAPELFRFHVGYVDYDELPLTWSASDGYTLLFRTRFQVVEDGGGTRDIVLATLTGMSDNIVHVEGLAVIDDYGYGGYNSASTNFPEWAFGLGYGDKQGVVCNVSSSRIMYANTNVSQFDFLFSGDNIILRYDMFGDDRTRYGYAFFKVMIGPTNA